MMKKRDLKADLELCNKATPGPWEVFPPLCGPEGQTVYQVDSGGPICDVSDPYPRGDNKPQENMMFIAQAREGWPHAIERAIKAEALAQKLLYVLGRVIPNYLVGRLEVDLDSVLEANGLLKKAKEVPGDE